MDDEFEIDWMYRLLTMLQMVGVIILALGLPAMYASIEQGHYVDNSVMVRLLRLAAASPRPHDRSIATAI